MVPGVRRKKIPQQKYQKKTLHKRLKQRIMKQIKYEIAGESGGQEKHKAEEVCERDYKKLEGVGKRARKPKSHHYHKTCDGD